MTRPLVGLVGVLLCVTAVQAEPRGRRWDDLAPAERDQALRHYREYQALPAERRRFLGNRYQRYQQMPKPERDRLKRNYRRYEELPSSERKRFNRKYRRWKDQGD